MLKSFSLAVLVFFVATANSQSDFGTSNFTPHICPGFQSNAEILELKITPCMQYDDGCTLERGRNTTIEMKFIPSRNVTHLGHKVHGKKGSSKLPFNKIPRNPCTLIRGGCPLIAGQEYIYVNSIPIERYYPTWEVLIEYELYATNNRRRQTFKLWCFRVHSIIQ